MNMEKIKAAGKWVYDWVMIAPWRFFVGAGLGFLVRAIFWG